jgi:hypothetical protein
MSAIEAREKQIKLIMSLNEQLTNEGGDKDALMQQIS